MGTYPWAMCPDPPTHRPTYRVWVLSDLDPDVPTLIRLEVHEAAAQAFPAAQVAQPHVHVQ